MPYRLRKTHKRRGITYQKGEPYAPTQAELLAFPDVFEEVPTVPQEKDASAQQEEARYNVVQRSPGWYDVVDGEGTPQNETAMRMADAETLRHEMIRRSTP